MDIAREPTAAGDGQAGDFSDVSRPYEFLLQFDDNIEAAPEVPDEGSDYFVDSIPEGLFFIYLLYLVTLLTILNF